jgi:hypothetical protein
MVLITNPINVTYKNKPYVVFSMKKNINIPIVLDKNIFDFIKKEKRHYYINDNLMVYTRINLDGNNKMVDIYLHEIVMKLKNKSCKLTPILHINKMNFDNRLNNLMFDTIDKKCTKNLHKKERIIDLSHKNINVRDIPSFVWYLNEDDTHGDRFIVDLGLIKWKSTSSRKLSLRYKLEEIKKYLRLHREIYPEIFRDYSMNGDLNKQGEILKKEYYDIIKLAGFNYTYKDTQNTSDFLKENLSGLSSLEKYLLKEFNLNNNETTNDRLKNIS